MRLMRGRAEAAGLTLDHRAARTLPEVEADYRAVKQVLLNLLSNAVKFTPARRPGDRARRGRRDPLGARGSGCQVRRHRHRHRAGRPGPPGQALRAGREPARQDHPGHGPGPGPRPSRWSRCTAARWTWPRAPGEGDQVSFILPINQGGLCAPTATSRRLELRVKKVLFVCSQNKLRNPHRRAGVLDPDRSGSPRFAGTVRTPRTR